MTIGSQRNIQNLERTTEETMQTIADLVEETFKKFGASVAQTFAQSFTLKFGADHPAAIEAQETIDRLTNPKPSHSQALADLVASATVVIPNTRSSDKARVRGRSVD